VRAYSAIFVVLYIAHIVSTCLRLLHMLRRFAQHLLSHGLTPTSELLVFSFSPYAHDSLPPIGGESNSGSTRSCR